MKVLLIEDEVAHCDKYVKCAENLPYLVELSVADGLKKATALSETGDAIDVILLDLEFNESDGDGVIFLKWLKSKTNLTPFIIVITKNTSKEVHRAVRNMGADYVFIKTKPDYSPRLVFDFANCILTSRSREDTSMNNTIEERIAKKVEKIGFTHDVIGTEYLINAVEVVVHAGKLKISLDKDIYPVIAKRHKKSDLSIARAIRTAIMRVWRITDIDTLVENYTPNVDYDLGYPTNKQMILFIAGEVTKEARLGQAINARPARSEMLA